MRPTSVTVVAWFLIMTSGFSLITSVLMLNKPLVRELMAQSPLPLPVQHTLTYLGSLATIASGCGMLLGQNWARMLYMIWGAVGFLIATATTPIKIALIPGFVVYVLIVFFLLRPRANSYFDCSEV